MLDPTVGTVDHFLSVKHHRHLGCDWGNYGFASATMNASRQSADAALLDPYQVGDGWFEIVLPSLQMCARDAVPAAMKAKAEYTLQRLKLRDGERVIRWRQSWCSLYCSGGLTLDGLRQVAPLLANAVAAAALSSRSPPPRPPAA